MEEEEEFQEADVLWPWPDTPPPSPEEEEGSYDGYGLPHAAAPEMYEYDAAAIIDFSCEPFSGPAASWSATSSTLSAALLSSDWSDGGGGFLLSGAYTVSAARVELGAAEESFLEADVLWPDTTDDADDDAAEFLWRRRRRSGRRIEEAAAASAEAAVFCGKGPALVASSPIDIPMATRGAAAAARRRWP